MQSNHMARAIILVVSQKYQITMCRKQNNTAMRNILLLFFIIMEVQYFLYIALDW